MHANGGCWRRFRTTITKQEHFFNQNDRNIEVCNIVYQNYYFSNFYTYTMCVSPDYSTITCKVVSGFHERITCTFLGNIDQFFVRH